jgi:hypothetical protein
LEYAVVSVTVKMAPEPENFIDRKKKIIKYFFTG